MTPIASVVVPAHDEAAVIGRCLDRLLDGGSGEFEVVVVANACGDDTAEVARSRGVTVIETAEPGKANALNLGDAACTVFPRIYLDADVDLPRASALAIAKGLATAPVVAPRMTWSPDGVGRAVRAYYRVWTAMPYHRDGVVGSGVYALSAAGRARFTEFPAIVADDGFVAAQFARHERLSLPDCTFTIHPPRTLRSLVRIKSRVWVGNEELDRHRPITPVERDGGGARGFSLAARPDLWIDLPVYVAVYATARLAGWWRLRAGRTAWTRDETSRVSPDRA